MKCATFVYDNGNTSTSYYLTFNKYADSNGTVYINEDGSDYDSFTMDSSIADFNEYESISMIDENNMLKLIPENNKNDQSILIRCIIRTNFIKSIQGRNGLSSDSNTNEECGPFIASRIYDDHITLLKVLSNNEYTEFEIPEEQRVIKLYNYHGELGVKQ